MNKILLSLLIIMNFHGTCSLSPTELQRFSNEDKRKKYIKKLEKFIAKCDWNIQHSCAPLCDTSQGKIVMWKCHSMFQAQISTKYKDELDERGNLRALAANERLMAHRELEQLKSLSKKASETK